MGTGDGYCCGAPRAATDEASALIRGHALSFAVEGRLISFRVPYCVLDRLSTVFPEAPAIIPDLVDLF